MRHAYLTKEEIDRAYRLGGITRSEVNELLHTLEKCAAIAAMKASVHS